MHETKYLTVPAYAEEIEAEQTEGAAAAMGVEMQPLTEDVGVMEAKGERGYSK